MSESDWKKLELTDMPKDLTVLDFMVVGEDGAEYPVMMQDVIIQTIEGNYDVFYRIKPDPLEEAAKEYGSGITPFYTDEIIGIVNAFKAGANWQKEHTPS